VNNYTHKHFHYFCGKPKIPWYVRLRRWALRKLGRSLLWVWRRVIWAFLKSLNGTFDRVFSWFWCKIFPKPLPPPAPPPTPRLSGPRVVNPAPSSSHYQPRSFVGQGQRNTWPKGRRGRKRSQQFNLWGEDEQD